MSYVEAKLLNKINNCKIALCTSVRPYKLFSFHDIQNNIWLLKILEMRLNL